MSEVKTNKLSSVATNGNLTLEPNGTGLIVPKRQCSVWNVRHQIRTNQYAAGANPVIEWEDVSLDTGSYWDTTNHRYVYTSVAGWYLFGGVVSSQRTN